MQGAKPFTIGFVTDPTLGREKTQIALRALNSLRAVADIRYYPGHLSEEELVARVQRESLDLLMVPWHAYLHYSKLEAHFGLTRLYGPTLVGYFADVVTPNEIQEQDHHFRAILIDLNRLSTPESAAVLKSLLKDTTRWGLRPYLLPATPIHYETWNAQVGLGFRADAVLALPEIAASHWNKRANAIRILVSSLWSLIFDTGPGKMDRTRPNSDRRGRAYFEVAADVHALGIRLCYNEPGWKVKDVLHQFWPGALTRSAGAQALTQFADVVRVHVDPETNDIEVTAILYPSAPAEQGYNELRTLWIEPLSKVTCVERFAEMMEDDSSNYRALITHHELISNATEKIDELQGKLDDAYSTIQELKSRGATKENVFVYPNGLGGEELADLFKRRIMEARNKIRYFSAQIQAIRMENNGSANSDAVKLAQDVRDLQLQIKSWMTRMQDTVEEWQRLEAPTGELPAPAPPAPAKTPPVQGGHSNIEDALAEMSEALNARPEGTQSYAKRPQKRAGRR